MPTGKKVIYLSGAPAAGKSTLIRTLAEHSKTIMVFEYGKSMADWLKQKSPNTGAVDQARLRSGTDEFVTQDDIDGVDASMATWVNQHRSSHHLIIDSHHVTIERFGFRIVPFTIEKLVSLNIDEFWLLVLDPASTQARITADQRGRRLPTNFQADFHTMIQASLVVQYAVMTGRAVYTFDSSAPADELARYGITRLGSV